ncbi:MAG: MMPL family transporter [Alphaproteobacteria bacterium]|nr:MMPL family transporter [Alphaproteobacteria bacterium]
MTRVAIAFREVLVACVDGAQRQAVLVVSVWLALTAGLGYYAATSFRIQASDLDLISAELPFQRTYLEFRRVMPRLTNTMVVVVRGETPDLAEDAAARLVTRMRSETELFRFVDQPGSGAFFDRHGLLYLDKEELAELIDRLATVQPFLGELAIDPSLRGFFDILRLAIDAADEDSLPEENLAEVLDVTAATIEAETAGRFRQFSWHRLLTGDTIDGDANTRVILAQLHLEDADIRPAQFAIERVRALSRALSLDAAHGVRVSLTGGQVVDDEEFVSATSGAGLAAVISFVLVSVLVALGFGSVRLIACVLFTLLCGLVWSTALGLLVVGHFNLISVAFAVLFIGLGVDFGIHFSLRYGEELRLGRTGAPAFRGTAAGVGGALVLCAVSTAIGFYAFAPTHFVGLAELGVIAGNGMFVTLFANLTLLPALLALARPRPREPRYWTRAMLGLQHIVERRRKTIVLSALALGVGGLALLPQARFDLDPLNLKDPETESMRTLRELHAETDQPFYTIGILVTDLSSATALASRLEALEVVDAAVTLASYVPDDQDAKLELIDQAALMLWPVLEGAEPAGAASAEDNRAAIAALRRALDALPPSAAGADLTNSARRLRDAFTAFDASGSATDERLDAIESRLLSGLAGRLDKLRLALSAKPISVRDLPEEIRGRMVASDGRARIEVLPKEDLRDYQALRRFVSDVRGIAPDATDDPVAVVEAGRAVTRAVIQATATALVLIVALLLIRLRSVADTAIVMLPLALAGIFTAAATVLLDIPFNFANVIVLPLILGLGLDNGIHLVLRHEAAQATGAHVLATSTPRAVLLSALTTICSFGSLSLSPHVGTASMGILLTLAVSFTLLSTLVVLPALLMRRQRTANL